MSKHKPIFYSAILLTGVNLILRFTGTSFQIYISNRIGAAGVGLLQLVMSVAGFIMIAGVAGIRTATMYLTAEELGKGRPEHVPEALSACFLYSIVCSAAVAFLVGFFSGNIAERWIGNPATRDSLRLYAGFLPAICLSTVMTGYFTAAGRIGTLSAVEVIEQFFTMGITILLLSVWAGADSVKACQSILLGNCLGSILTLLSLVCLGRIRTPFPHRRNPIRKRLLAASLPLAAADILKAGINTLENLMVPLRLKLNPAVTDPLAAFGAVSGMVFPVIMFPACVLFALSELLIPELARCNAASSTKRIDYLVRRSLKVSLLYGLIFGCMIFMLADTLCIRFYGNNKAAHFMKLYALLIPMLYCDAIVDAMTKGLGQQKICVRYNIITAGLDILLLYFVLPVYGMHGYYFSFALTHLVNFILSYRRLLMITRINLPFYIPAYSIASALASTAITSVTASDSARAVLFPLLFFCMLKLFGVLQKEDLQWINGLCFRNTISRKKASRINRLA